MFAQVRQIIQLMVLFVVLGFMTLSATIIYVPDDYSTIQAGIDASSNGDTVLVAWGHYYERINFYGKGILLTSEFMVDGDTLHIQSTIIDADTSVLGVADTGSVVCFVNGEDSTSVIQGFTIQNGIGTVYDSYRLGGGIFCLSNSSPTIRNNTISENSALESNYARGGGIYSSGSSPTISNNTISENSANGTNSWGGGICFQNSNLTISNNTISENSADYGGGICFQNSNPTICNNTITGNSAGRGGGIHCFDSNSSTICNNTISENSACMGGGIICRRSSPTINNNTISENSANGINVGGGGIWCDYSNPTISNNKISGNRASAGGGIYCTSSNPTISNNTITENSSGYYGGGISCWDNSSPTISNNTITENSSGYYGGGIFCNYSNPVVINTILWDNIADSVGNEIYLYYSSSISITFSDIQDGWEGEGNIDADPYFCFSDTAYYWLAENSPCVGTGCDSFGNPDSTVNIGAFGIGCEEHLDISDINIVLPYSFTLSQNYPNPFNPTTTISFTIEHPQFVTLKVYDLLGRDVRTLIDEDKQAGLHNIIFDVSDLSSGMYFYRLQAGDVDESKRMVLLK